MLTQQRRLKKRGPRIVSVAECLCADLAEICIHHIGLVAACRFRSLLCARLTREHKHAEHARASAERDIGIQTVAEYAHIGKRRARLFAYHCGGLGIRLSEVARISSRSCGDKRRDSSAVGHYARIGRAVEVGMGGEVFCSLIYICTCALELCVCQRGIKARNDYIGKTLLTFFATL